MDISIVVSNSSSGVSRDLRKAGCRPGLGRFSLLSARTHRLRRFRYRVAAFRDEPIAELVRDPPHREAPIQEQPIPVKLRRRLNERTGAPHDIVALSAPHDVVAV